MDWRGLIAGIYETRAQPAGIAGKPRFYPPASADDITAAEARLNVALPSSFRSLMAETDGVMDLLSIDGGEWFDSMWLVWTLEEIGAQNVRCRRATADGTHDRDFDQLAFFAGAGVDGILFGFPVSEDRTCERRVVVWHPMRDTITETASDLETFLRGWLTGAIAV